MKFFEALPPCLIGMEACATAHYWARELTRLGHEVRLMPAKPFARHLRIKAAEPGDVSTRACQAFDEAWPRGSATIMNTIGMVLVCRRSNVIGRLP